jgi:hypothetical protein
METSVHAFVIKIIVYILLEYNLIKYMPYVFLIKIKIIIFNYLFI